MPIVTDIANLSQTPALNGPDGAVDPPSSLDDQDRYLGSFIAKLRDGVGFTANALTSSLGYTPVRQGTGPGQLPNMTAIGWSTANRLLVAVDNNAFGNVWPIDADAALKLRSGGVLAGAAMVFTWNDPGGAPAYLWGGDGAGASYVVPPSRLNVNYANSAGTSSACSGNAATASNASAVNGISGWNYSNRAKNPTYIWATDGAGNDQYLTQPGNLSVNYANSAGTVARSQNSDNSDRLGGAPVGFWINNGNTAVVNIRNQGASFLIANISGFGDVAWAVNAVSDQRLKKDVAPTAEDSLSKIARINFVRFRYRSDVTQLAVDDGHLHPIGLVAQQAEAIDPNWITQGGTYKALDQFALLAEAMHAIQQLNAQVQALTARLP